jgi:hypothetical protein
MKFHRLDNTAAVLHVISNWQKDTAEYLGFPSLAFPHLACNTDILYIMSLANSCKSYAKAAHGFKKEVHLLPTKFG